MALFIFRKGNDRVEFSNLDAKIKLNIEDCLEKRIKSLELMRTTVDPETFFENFEIWFTCERTVTDLLSEIPASQREKEYPEILDFDFHPSTRSKYQIDFIRRALFVGKDEELKSQMPLYSSKMTEECTAYFENNVGPLSFSKQANKEYIFCSVLFPGTSRLYDYLTDDETIKPKDKVVVPAGYKNEEKIAKVIRIRRFTANELSFPPEKVKHIIRKIEDENQKN